MDADPPVAIGQPLDREGVVDFGRTGIVDAEGGDGGQRQFGMIGHGHFGETGAARKMLEQKFVQVVVVRGRQGAAAFQQVCGRQMGGGAGRFQRLDFERVAIRFVQQYRQLVAEFGGQAKAHQFVGKAHLQLGLQALFLCTGERGLERLRRRSLVAPLAFLVKMHRRRVQADQRTARFGRRRRVAKILFCQGAEFEFFRRRSFPQEFHIDGGGGLFGLRLKLGQSRLLEA